MILKGMFLIDQQVCDDDYRNMILQIHASFIRSNFRAFHKEQSSIRVEGLAETSRFKYTYYFRKKMRCDLLDSYPYLFFYKTFEEMTKILKQHKLVPLA